MPKISILFARFRFFLSGNCYHGCGYATFRHLDGQPFRMFVPEADCPIHDYEAFEDEAFEDEGRQSADSETND